MLSKNRVKVIKTTLTNASFIDATIKELQKISPDTIYPCHCTGSKATSTIKELFCNQCKPIHTGDGILL